MVFALHGFFAGIATLVYATQLRVIQSTTPPGLELTVITAAVVGGVSILGGVGTVVGATLAAILIAEITSALVFINISPYWTDALRGGLILATVIADILRRQRRVARGTPDMSAVAQSSGRGAPWWLKRHETLLAIILVVALIGLGAFNDRFLTIDNLLNQGRLMTEIGLIALPMTFVIITGGIDLSVGAIVGLCAVMLGYSWKTFGFPLPLAIAFALFVGALAGFVNGLVITRIKVPPLIMTIATLALYRGLAEGVSQAHSVRGYPEWFYVLGQGDVFGVPTQLLILIVLIVVAGVALDRTTFGRALYAIGSNETAARFSALNVDRTKLVIYTLSGLASGLAAVVLVSRVTTTRMDMGMGYELDVIAAVVLGGTSIFGGLGTIWGTVIGLVMIQLLKNGLALTGVKGDATIVVIGVALILSVLIASSLQRRRE